MYAIVAGGSIAYTIHVRFYAGSQFGIMVRLGVSGTVFVCRAVSGFYYVDGGFQVAGVGLVSTSIVGLFSVSRGMPIVQGLVYFQTFSSRGFGFRPCSESRSFQASVVRRFFWTTQGSFFK